MELQAETRSALGKSVKSLRKQGFVPAEFYGHGFENQTLAIAKGDFDKALRDAGESTVINLLVGGKKYPSLITDVQRHPLSGEVIHADFYGVHMDEKITASVPLEFVGEAPAVKAEGGVLNKAVTEIEVEALPADLPHSIQVDLSGLTALNQSIYLSDLKLPSTVKAALDPETVLATVMPPAAEEETPAAPVDVSAVVVESEEKKAERDAEKAKEGEKSE